MGLAIVTPPSAEPVSLAQAKLFLRIDTANGDADDGEIADSFRAAREQAEDFMRRPVLATGYVWTLDEFPGHGLNSYTLAHLQTAATDRDDLILRLPIGGVTAVTAITYVDPEGIEQTLGPERYRVDVIANPARIAPAFNQSWPATQTVLAAVSIRFTAGWPADAVPAAVIRAIKLMAGHNYENRADVASSMAPVALPMGAEHRLWPYRIFPVERG